MIRTVVKCVCGERLDLPNDLLVDENNIVESRSNTCSCSRVIYHHKKGFLVDEPHADSRGVKTVQLTFKNYTVGIPVSVQATFKI